MELWREPITPDPTPPPLVGRPGRSSCQRGAGSRHTVPETAQGSVPKQCAQRSLGDLSRQPGTALGEVMWQPGGLGNTGAHGLVRPGDIWVTLELCMGVTKGQSTLPAACGNSAAPRQEGGGEGFEELRWNF